MRSGLQQLTEQIPAAEPLPGADRRSGLVVALGLVGVNRLTGTGVAHQQTRTQAERTGASGTRTEQTGGRTRGRELATGLVSAIDRCRSTIGRC